MSLGSLLMNWRRGTETHASPGEKPADVKTPVEPAGVSFMADAASDERLARELRYAGLLSRDAQENCDSKLLDAAWKSIENDMALVPAGHISLGTLESPDHDVEQFVKVEPKQPQFVQSYYLDRHTVRNRDFARFVANGGYDRMELWPEEIWPSVVQFVDQTGLPGPRFWSHGRPVRGKDDHPVVGVSWFEANAYAKWVGKRLPNAAEWEKAGSWPADLFGRGPRLRYPWGNAFDPSRSNTWTSGLATTVPVDHYPNGCTPNGIYQMIGNVWEWIEDRFLGPEVLDGFRVFFDQPMGETRGAAFDTYFEVQATCQFRTGQPLLARSANLGFRCAVSADALRPRSEA
jgi:iron(II)-dependent oxidoreductase